MKPQSATEDSLEEGILPPNDGQFSGYNNTYKYFAGLLGLKSPRMAWILRDISTSPKYQSYMQRYAPTQMPTEMDFTEQDRAIAFLRQCLTDDFILRMIGDLRRYNITSANNPSIQVIDYEMSRGPGLNAFYDTAYLQGEADPSLRVIQFWRIFLGRIGMGDAISNALHVAADYARYFRVANFSIKAAEWYRGPTSYSKVCQVNSYVPQVDGDLYMIYTDLDIKLSLMPAGGIPPIGNDVDLLTLAQPLGKSLDLANLSFLNNIEQEIYPKIKYCFLSMLQSFYQNYFPADWANLQVNSLSQNIEAAALPLLDGEYTTTDKLLMAAGLGLWAYSFLKKGKTNA